MLNYCIIIMVVIIIAYLFIRNAKNDVTIFKDSDGKYIIQMFEDGKCVYSKKFSKKTLYNKLEGK